MVVVFAIGPVRFVLLAAAVLFYGPLAEAQSSRAYVIGYRHNPPYVMADSHGQPAGLAHDVVSMAAARRSIRLHWRFTSLVGSEFLGRGHAELWPLADPLDFGQGLGVTRPWLSDSIYLMQLEAAARQGSPVERLGVNGSRRTMELARQAFPDAQLVPAEGGMAAMERFCRGEADALFINSRVAEALLLRRPPACTGVAFARSVVQGVNLPLGVGFRPEARAAAEDIRGEIEAMSRDGSLGEQFSRWAILANSDVEQKNLLLRAERSLSRYRLAAWLTLFLLAAAIATAVLFRRAHRLAQQAAESKSRFIATVSHELRTPLSGFLSLSELLLKTPLSADQRDLAEAIHASSQSFGRIVEDVLDFARISQGKLHLQAIPTQVPQLMREVARLLSGRAAARGLSLHVDAPADFPWLLVDAVRLRQILLNLADNAIKFTPSGSVTMTARLEAGEPRGGGLPVVLEVADTGVGIAAGQLPRLFVPFHQLDQRDARRFGGLGLGLAICRDLVKAMQGEIEAQSEVGVGTTMRVRLTLPRADPPAEPEPAAAPCSAPLLRVLVVDDNRTNLHVASRLLKKLGHEVEQATSGAQAVERVSSSLRGDGPALDLVIMDCQMPEVDGFEATRRIRAQEPAGRHLPIVAWSASVQACDREQCHRAGMDHFLPKPISLQQLAHMIDHLSRGGPE
ncbi:MAG: response regulator [Bryobacterales bacterium]|nr:response regulator [Bryobacterales bacterium]